MTAAKDVIHPASSPTCGDEVDGIKASCPVFIRAFFVGGAGDKKEYLFQGPNHNIVPVKMVVDEEVKPIDIKNRYASYYLGYDEVRGTNDINTYVTTNIPDSRTHVYIVGHSLGGWNGAHLSQILTDNGYMVKMLVTLDPVGKGSVVQWISDVYSSTPTPRANYWINVRASPNQDDSSDTVAKLGERWVIDEKTTPQPNAQHVANVHHAYAKLLFDAGGPSAHTVMVQSILETIRTNP